MNKCFTLIKMMTAVAAIAMQAAAQEGIRPLKEVFPKLS